MITSQVDICNMALDYCNIKNITSMDENTKESIKCNNWYDTVRKSLLSNMNASFSIKRATLPEVANYTPVYGYKKAYKLPNDLIQLLNVGNPLEDIFYQIEGQYLYVKDIREDIVNIRYIADIEDVTKYDADFCDVFALKLAEKICLPLTEDIEKTNYLKQFAQQRYIECSSKYGRDNRMIIINKPNYRDAKFNAEIQNFNYPLQ